jgi:hypothetical protein
MHLLLLQFIRFAQGVQLNNCPGGGDTCQTGLGNTPATSQNLQAILTQVFAIAGALAVIVIVIGGFQYITAQGDPSSTSKAKRTIVFALIGLVVALLAEAFVTFVLKNLPA